MPKIVITSSIDGKRRAGTAFTGAKEFELDHFTPEQLKAIAADPVLSVVHGEIITAGEVDGFLANAGKPSVKARAAQ